MRRLALALLALWLAACARPPLHSQESFVFGTRVEVLVWGDREEKARAAVGEVLRDFDRLHRSYHAWQPSELTRLNEALAAGRNMEVSEELAGLIGDAKAAAAAGEHLFDPGIGRLVALWGFHDDEFKPRLPDAAELRALVAARPSIADVEISGRTVSSRNRAVALDFGGYLKGVALDRAAATMKRAGIDDALINIGGNVIALGSKGGTPWRVGIQHPRGPAPMASLELRDGEAIGTSGDYQRYFELEGRRYCHLIDPRNGMPADATEALTILVPPAAGAGMWSDVGSKPLFVGGDDWQRMAGKLGLSQVLRVDGNGRAQVTVAMQRRLQWHATDIAVESVP